MAYFRRPLTLFRRYSLNNLFSRNYHAELLNDRTLISVQGPESIQFLQGLITNDINDEKSVIYSLMLNVKGRVLFDIIIRRNSDTEFFVECDASLRETLTHHLKMYKVRRKVNIEHLPNWYIWSIFDENLSELSLNFDTIFKQKGDLGFLDPRLKYFGRLWTDKNDIANLSTNIEQTKSMYKKLCYKLGVGEGAGDIISGKSLPLEVNSDYLNGVNFHKGCYIGQELTARTHHTGVIRKRLMPLIFEFPVSLEQGVSIINEKGKSVGKVINSFDSYGLGLLKISEALKANSLCINNIPVKTFKPDWWPLEELKEPLM